ncbi:hypothetical protein PSTT_10737 [Puccinia striiformis]|uniref:Uncharacterized protein n=2 Tax=Puccinia striiformis TaxID=27350 RepID=A0A2S4V330_9BASI|nr:hypothetical protein PSTT_10737 [Puccinia striiformis]
MIITCLILSSKSNIPGSSSSNLRHRLTDDGLDECHCSNCDIEKFKVGLSKIIHMRNNNFDELVANPENIKDNPLNRPFLNPETIAEWNPGPTDAPLAPVLESFARSLLGDYEIIFAESFDLSVSDFLPSELFDIETARIVALALDRGLPLNQVERLIKGEPLPGLLHVIQSAWDRFSSGEIYSMYTHEQKTYEEVVFRRYLELQSEMLISEQTQLEKKTANQLALKQQKAEQMAKKIQLEKEKDERRIAKQAKAVLKQQEDSIKQAEKEEKARKKTEQAAANLVAERKRRLKKEEDDQHLAMLQLKAKKAKDNHQTPE